MKRFYSRAGKIFLGINCTVFTFIFAVSFFLCVIFGNWGLFAQDNSEFKHYVNNHAGSNYGVWVMANADSGFTSERLQDTNCYYGVIEGDRADEVDLNADSSYVYRNFKGVDVPKDAYIASYSIDEYTRFSLGERLIDPWDENRIDNYDSTEYLTYDIDGIGYDLIGQKAYIYGNGRFYLLKDYFYSYDSNDSTEGTPNTNAIYSRIWENNRTQKNDSKDVVEYSYNEEATKESDERSYVIEDTSEAEENPVAEETIDYLPEEHIVQGAAVGLDSNMLYIDGVAYPPLSDSETGYTLELDCNTDEYGILNLKNVADLTAIHSDLSKVREEVSLENISTFGLYESVVDSKEYTFVCFPNETKLAASTYTNDFYGQAKTLISVLTGVKYILPVAAVLSFVIALGSWIIFLCVAGHKKGVEGIVEGPIEKIPADLAFVGALILEGIVFGLVSSVQYSSSGIAFGLLGMVVAFGGAMAMLIGFLWSSNIAVNVKLHHLFSNSIIGKCWGIVKKWLRKFHEEYRGICSKIKWTNRIWVIFIIIMDIEFFALWATGTTKVALFFILEKIAFGIILHKLLLSYAKIKGTAMALAEGDTTAQVDLKGMPLFLEEHAKAMNDIQSGITVALEERTKSERMKTELITNVSHDIKTPLTSIINYVDLLEKEDIENDKAKEYLEVLDRQSKRLKKLIEDLIEASKVSTGNIKFNIEKVNAVVLLNQSIGEFSDRLDANKITVVSSLPSEDVYLQADNRYLWRVFDNLMSNIVKYAQPNTRAYVDLEQDENKLRFVFRNTSKEELNITADELMERFVRGDKSRYTDGNGLGLSIARSLAEAMGGSLKLAIDGDLFKAIVEFNKV
ncbi:MAG: hypothetical protein IJR96_01535 [Pseudobutyrivibrio sp.]|nr:hypothetical protein [Pseudobutyrivibrio sp.]